MSSFIFEQHPEWKEPGTKTILIDDNMPHTIKDFDIVDVTTELKSEVTDFITGLRPSEKTGTDHTYILPFSDYKIMYYIGIRFYDNFEKADEFRGIIDNVTRQLFEMIGLLDPTKKNFKTRSFDVRSSTFTHTLILDYRFPREDIVKLEELGYTVDFTDRDDGELDSQRGTLKNVITSSRDWMRNHTNIKYEEFMKKKLENEKTMEEMNRNNPQGGRRTL
jgi:hypothetical protein